MEGRDYDHHDDEQMELPPGFRFHPTDEELMSHYLHPKVFDANFVAKAIGEVDLNKVEPWDLPWMAKLGEKEWYFFCVRDRKYPTGLRTNRATDAGYWKATGKDKEIYKDKSLVGMKKTLVFYKGRAPRGLKTNWVMHEYRLDGKFSINNLPPSAKGEWVISRIFHKSSGGKKISISGLLRMNKDNHEHEFDSSNLPPLLDISSMNGETRRARNAETSHVTCFSESMEEQKPNNEDMVDISNKYVKKMDNNVSSITNTCFIPNQMVENYQYQETDWLQDPNILRLLIDDNNNPNILQIPKAELSGNQDYSMNLAGAVDSDFLWNY